MKNFVCIIIGVLGLFFLEFKGASQIVGWPQSVYITNSQGISISNNVRPVTFQSDYDKPITNCIVNTNYTGTIQVGTNFYMVKDLQPVQETNSWPPPISRNWFPGMIIGSSSKTQYEIEIENDELWRRYQETHPIPLTTNWLGSVITGERFGGGKPNGLLDTSATDEQIGLRSDGVVVWRKRP